MKVRLTATTWLAMLLAMVLLLDTTPVQAQPPTGRKLAFLVGVKNYDSDQLGDLKFTENDVIELDAVLKKQKFETIVMTSTLGEKSPERRPTAENLRRALAKQLEGTTKRDLVIVGLAGHGLQLLGQGESYFCPQDANPSVREEKFTRPETLWGINEILQTLTESNVGVKLLLVDACRNDPSVRGRRGVTQVRTDALPPRTAVMLSCKPGQYSFEHGKLGTGHGVFFHHVIEGMRQEAADKRGEVTWDDLAKYVRQQVPSDVEQLFGAEGGEQIPNLILNLDEVPVLARVSTTSTPVKPLRSAPSVKPPVKPIPPSSSAETAAKEYISKSTGMKFALIPAGTFRMGSSATEIAAVLKADPTAVEESSFKKEQPQHTVRISQPFYMGVYEVTQAEYESVMGQNPSAFSKTGSKRSKVSGLDTSKFPVESVSYIDAIEFCQKLSVKDGVTYRLPTEAEWEYACRAGTKTPFYFGSTLSADKANVVGNIPFVPTKGKFLERTTTVGAYSANAFGLFDMHGNVLEWCEDSYDESAYGQRSGTTSDPKVTAGLDYRVMRGGSWITYSPVVRSAYRLPFPPGERDNICLGFRVVVSSSAVRTP